MDLYIPDFRIAIEYDSIYGHSKESSVARDIREHCPEHSAYFHTGTECVFLDAHFRYFHCTIHSYMAENRPELKRLIETCRAGMCFVHCYERDLLNSAGSRHVPISREARERADLP